MNDRAEQKNREYAFNYSSDLHPWQRDAVKKLQDADSAQLHIPVKTPMVHKKKFALAEKRKGKLHYYSGHSYATGIGTSYHWTPNEYAAISRDTREEIEMVLEHIESPRCDRVQIVEIELYLPEDYED